MRMSALCDITKGTDTFSRGGRAGKACNCDLSPHFWLIATKRWWSQPNDGSFKSSNSSLGTSPTPVLLILLLLLFHPSRPYFPLLQLFLFYIPPPSVFILPLPVSRPQPISSTRLLHHFPPPPSAALFFPPTPYLPSGRITSTSLCLTLHPPL